MNHRLQSGKNFCPPEISVTVIYNISGMWDTFCPQNVCIKQALHDIFKISLRICYRYCFRLPLDGADGLPISSATLKTVIP